MTAAFTRDAAATAAIFGFFASVWFGWAQEQPPDTWRRWLIAGAVLSLTTAVAGGVVTWQKWFDGTAFNPASGRLFGIIVGIEFAVAGLGAWALISRHRAELVSAWVALVVGIHFIPLAGLLQYPLLYLVAGLMIAVALAAAPLARARGVAVSAITGAGAGVVLLATAIYPLASVVV